ISYQLSVISYQLSVISYQLSVISYQLSVISYQLSVISYQGDREIGRKRLAVNSFLFYYISRKSEFLIADLLLKSLI
ncbi:hypothetical protein, partial [Microcystis sp. M113S1]|uniref:hypothetical protein n=1 Tax=Microcystis sp. M113S1 TaxID=2771104 RepID=UPI00258EC8D5